MIVLSVVVSESVLVGPSYPDVRPVHHPDTTRLLEAVVKVNAGLVLRLHGVRPLYVVAPVVIEEFDDLPRDPRDALSCNPLEVTYRRHV